MSRADMVLAVQLRTGECRITGRLRYRFDKGSSLCRWCNNVDETVAHIFTDCPHLDLISTRTYLNINDTSVLFDDPPTAVHFRNKAISFLPTR